MVSCTCNPSAGDVEIYDLWSSLTGWSGQISLMETFRIGEKNTDCCLTYTSGLHMYLHTYVYTWISMEHIFILMNSFFKVSEAGKLTIKAQTSDHNLYVVWDPAEVKVSLAEAEIRNSTKGIIFIRNIVSLLKTDPSWPPKDHKSYWCYKASNFHFDFWWWHSNHRIK